MWYTGQCWQAAFINLSSKGSWIQKANKDQINENDQICIPYRLCTNTPMWLIPLRQSMHRKTAWRDCHRGSLWGFMKVVYLWHASNTWILENCLLTVNCVLTVSYFRIPFLICAITDKKKSFHSVVVEWQGLVQLDFSVLVRMFLGFFS